MYIFQTIGNIAWTVRNLQNMEDSVFGPKPSRHFNLDKNDFNVVDNNDNIPLNIESSYVENLKLSRKKNH